MVVLKKEKPILILFRSAFYKEIEEIPKKIKNKMNKNGGCGTVFENGLYFWSNTSGVTAGKMFKKERDEIQSWYGFLNKDVVLVTVVMKSDIFPIIRINTT